MIYELNVNLAASIEVALVFVAYLIANRFSTIKDRGAPLAMYTAVIYTVFGISFRHFFYEEIDQFWIITIVYYMVVGFVVSLILDLARLLYNKMKKRKVS